MFNNSEVHIYVLLEDTLNCLSKKGEKTSEEKKFPRTKKKIPFS